MPVTERDILRTLDKWCTSRDIETGKCRMQQRKGDCCRCEHQARDVMALLEKAGS